MKKSTPAFLDFLGFLLLLIAATWQIFFTDWFAAEQFNYQAYVSNEMTYQVLRGIGRIGEQLDAGKPTGARSLQSDMDEVVMRAIQQRDEKAKGFDRQSTVFSNVRAWLFIIGSICVVVGKFFAFMIAKRDR